MTAASGISCWTINNNNDSVFLFLFVEKLKLKFCLKVWRTPAATAIFQKVNPFNLFNSPVSVSVQLQGRDSDIKREFWTARAVNYDFH